MEKLGAPMTRATMLVAAGHAETLEEAEQLVAAGQFDALMGLNAGEKLGSVRTVQLRDQVSRMDDAGGEEA